MPLGLETAMSEITLVLFTTLAPSGAIACAIVAAVLIGAPLGEMERSRINRALCIPLVVTMAGLVASATHLGSPANALYVFAGVGRSPLSNEVFSAVLFLAACGLYWLFCFTEKQYVRVQKAWCGVVIVSAIACVGAIALAYDAPTIATWHTPSVPANVWLSACVGGPLLAMTTLRVARAVCLHTVIGKALPAAAGVSLAANAACLVFQNAGLSDIWNGYGTALDLAPWYPAMVVVYVAAGAMALGVAAFALHKGGLPSVARLIACDALFFAGLFVVRFGFYMMHMTYGLGV
ncbi:MAG: dimethyl sulfoxide reductase anchor subunit [Slackia sp.]|nr:dimethyl sulfoxide reductase anchor subunit [Slackia sp.]